MVAMSESDLVAKIKTRLKRIPKAYFIKVHGDSYLVGEPDLIGCIEALAVAIEIKLPGEVPTPNQMAHLEMWRRAGALAFWATSMEEVATTLRQYGIEVGE